MANDAGRATTCRRKFKAPWLQTERTKNEGPSEKMSFNGEQFENFKPRKPRNPIILWRTKQKNHKNLKAKTEHEPCSQEENNEAKLKKAFRRKLFELCKTRTKKSSPDLFNFYVFSAGHDMAKDAGRAIKCRHNFKDPWLQTERTKKGPSEKTSFNGEQFENFKPNIRGIQSSYEEQNKRTTKTWRQKLNMNHVARKKIMKQNWKKHSEGNCSNSARPELRSQVLTCSTFTYSRLVMTWPRTLAGLSRAGAVSKPHHYKQNVQRMKGLLKKRAWTESSLKFSNQKAKISTPPMENKTKDQQDPKGKAEHEPCSQEEINWSEIEKKHSERNCSNSARPELRSQGLICSTFTYSRLVMTWPMTLAGLPCAGAISKNHDYKQNVQKMKGLLKKWALTGNSLKI